ncbi:uncharacterized protein PAC_18485 [Phialocephala subalpina]|uniref:Uncharacterized protein n=1 Tax=Phialocephala subalpina TaxID=576137 RepID=A0A1L7XU94_9HELO|nr:uncharacterized protein PAC_18485 [Phialocephala subalpina]
MDDGEETTQRSGWCCGDYAEATIHRKIYRNSFDLALKLRIQGPTPKTPQGFTILTPVLEDREPFHISNLPFMEFQTAIRLRKDALRSPNDPENVDSIHPPYLTAGYVYPDIFGPRKLSEDTSLLESSQVTELHQNIARQYHTIVVPMLKALLPTAALEQYSEGGSRTIPALETLHEAQLKLLFFSLANNLAGLDALPIRAIWDYVRNHISVPDLMLLAPGPTTSALAEKFFQCAIESGEVQVAEYLLQKRYVDANEQVCIIWGARYTPVERSANLQDIPMTKLLIHYKADVNKTHTKTEFGGGGALNQVIKMDRHGSHPDPALVHILLDYGVNFDPNLLRTVIEYGYAQMAEILVRKGAHDSYKEWTEFGIFHSAVEHLDSETATRIVQIMLDVKANINYVPDRRYEYARFRSTHDYAYPRKVLDIAAQRGYYDLVQMLLCSGAFLSEDTLTCAIQSANMDLVKYVLYKGARIDSITTFYKTPYSEAICNGDVDLIRLLEDQGALRHIEEKFCFKAAVCAAAKVGNLEVLQYLIQRRTDESENALRDALVEACEAGHEDIALLLIDTGADVNDDILCGSRDEGKSLPLYQALKRRMGGLVGALLNVDADVNAEAFGRQPLEAAIEWGDYSIIKDLLFAGADPNEAGKENPLMGGANVNYRFARPTTALAAAVTNGDIDLIRFLLEEGADPDDGTALLEATSQSRDVFHLLLESFAKRYPRGKKRYGSEALVKAIQEDNVPLFETLLKVNADFGGFCRNRKSPLVVAIEKKNLERVQSLIDRVVDLNSIICRRYRYSNTEPSRLTALLVSVRTKDPRIVQLLVNKGADVNFPPTRGVKRTPLQMAAEIGSLELVQLLIRNGAEVNGEPAERGGGTAMQLAAIGGFVGIAEELLKRGADVNAPAAKLHGRTAIEGAVEHGRIDMVRFLLNAHAEIKGSGHRPYERVMMLTKEKGHWVINEMLESFPRSGHNRRARFILSEDALKPTDVAETD